MEARAGTIPTRSGHALRASLFGAFALTRCDRTEIAISNRRVRALLAMLCLTPGEALDRDYVSKLLWPGRFQAQARASLRQCLLGLDKMLTPYGAAIVRRRPRPDRDVADPLKLAKGSRAASRPLRRQSSEGECR